MALLEWIMTFGFSESGTWDVEGMILECAFGAMDEEGEEEEGGGGGEADEDRLRGEEELD